VGRVGREGSCYPGAFVVRATARWRLICQCQQSHPVPAVGWCSPLGLPAPLPPTLHVMVTAAHAAGVSTSKWESLFSQVCPEVQG
jgi:hypothetical protein